MRFGPKVEFYLRMFAATALGIGTLSAQTRVDYQTTSDWGTGFQAQITIYNDAAQPIGGWTLSFAFAHNIDTIWDASVSSHQDASYVVQSAGWNAVIPAGGSVNFGFVGSPGNLTDQPSGFPLSELSPAVRSARDDG